MRQRALNGHVKRLFPHPDRITSCHMTVTPRRRRLRVDGVGEVVGGLGKSWGGIAHLSWNKETNKQN